MNKSNEELIDELQTAQADIANFNARLWSYGMGLTHEDRTRANKHLFEARQIILNRLKLLLDEDDARIRINEVINWTFWQRLKFLFKQLRA